MWTCNCRTMLPRAPTLIFSTPWRCESACETATISSMRSERSSGERSANSTRSARRGTRMSQGNRASFISRTRDRRASPSANVSAARRGSKANSLMSRNPALAVAARRQPEFFRQGLRDIGERVAPADRRRLHAGAEAEDRNVLARMIEAAPGRIVAVIGGDDAVIVRPHRGDDLRQPSIERFEAGRVAGNVAAMAVFGIEIDQIDENQSAIRDARQSLKRQVDMRHIVRAFHLPAGMAMGENVADLADRDDVAPRFGGALEKIAGRRRDGEVLAPRRARKFAGAAAEKRARNDAADLERIAELSRDAAKIVEPIEAERLFMRGDLQHRIRRRVADRLQSP